jgi:hypothetical protein
MMKYKVGDKVRIRRDLEIGQLYDGCLCTRGMQDLAGKVVCITEVHKIYGNHRYSIASSSWYWTDEMFEEVNEEMNKHVTIDVGGNKVIARCNGKTGVARCHPDDDFDFYTGAKIALERLEDAEKPYAWLKKRVTYYTPRVTSKDLCDWHIYNSDSWDEIYIKRGIVFKTPEEAIACAKKMLAAVKQEG